MDQISVFYRRAASRDLELASAGLAAAPRDRGATANWQPGSPHRGRSVNRTAQVPFVHLTFFGTLSAPVFSLLANATNRHHSSAALEPMPARREASMSIERVARS